MMTPDFSAARSMSATSVRVSPFVVDIRSMRGRLMRTVGSSSAKPSSTRRRKNMWTVPMRRDFERGAYWRASRWRA